MFQIFGHISGAHLNPCVTLAAVILRVLPDYMLAPIYVIAQFTGAYLGLGLLKVSSIFFIYYKAEFIRMFFKESLVKSG